MLRLCPSCKRKNRIPSSRLAQTGKCGACKEAIPPLASPVDVGPEEFDDIVGGAKVPVLVDFWAEWCGPCKRAAPEVKKVAQEMAGKAIVLKVDTEAHPGLRDRFEVQGIPNFLVMKDGEVIQQQAGLVTHTRMSGWLLDAARG